MEDRPSQAAHPTIARVHVVDDDAGFRASLTHVLNASGLRAVGYRCAGEFLSATDDETPGCIVLDLWMSDVSRRELMDRIAAHSAALPVICMSGTYDVDLSVQALKAGAVDVLVKPVAIERLLDSVRKALRDDSERRASRAELRKLADRYAALDRREQTVMQGVAAGKLNKQLAVELGTCERTIKAQRARVMRKLRLHSLAGLVRAARLLGVDATTGSSLDG